MRTIKIVGFAPDTDGVAAIYVDDVLYTYGDYYHDKIEDYSRGFVDSSILFLREDEIDISSYECMDEEMITDVVFDGNTPPAEFSQLEIKPIDKAAYQQLHY